MKMVSKENGDIVFNFLARLEEINQELIELNSRPETEESKHKKQRLRNERFEIADLLEK
ncbi:MAG: hypothetical protein ABI723_03355 [Bacteroidia bacterium]